MHLRVGGRGLLTASDFLLKIVSAPPNMESLFRKQVLSEDGCLSSLCCWGVFMPQDHALGSSSALLISQSKVLIL